MKRLWISLLLCLLLFQLNVVFASNKNSVSDPVTYDSYQNELRESNSSSKLSGKVWTDKSVIANKSSGNETLEIDNKKIEYNDDFIEVYSALGSNSEIGETKKAPIDLVIALDLSRSMALPLDENSEVDSELGRRKTKLDEMAEILNGIFKKVTDANEKNNVSLILFASYAKTVIPLDHISQVENKPFIRIDTLDFTASNVHNPRIKLAFCYKNSKGKVIEEKFDNKEGFDDKDEGLGHLTNFEAAYIEGFKQFTENNTESRFSNKPKLITLSDGVYTTCYYYSYSKINEYVVASGSDKGGQIIPMATLINSVYSKIKANENYTNSIEVVNLVSSYQSKPEDVTKVDALTNKNNYLLNKDSTPSNKTLEKCKELFDEWKTQSNDVEVGDDGFKLECLPADVSIDKFLENLNFIDLIEEVPLTQESKALDDLISTYLNDDFKPVDSSLKNSLDESGSLTYHETIGDYMQVNLKQMLLFSKSYEFREENRITNNGITTETYIPVTKGGTNAVIKNNSYTDPISFKLSDIKVKLITNPDGNQELKINIPTNAVPVFKTTVRYEQDYDQDSNRVIDSVYDNRSSIDSLPIRFIYGVNLRPEILNDDNTLNLNEIDQDYLNKHQNGEEVEFFTTKYDGNSQANTYNAESDFIPDMDNSYYLSQEDYPIYSDYSSTENSVRHTLNRKEELNKDSIYYLEKPYYYNTGSKCLKEKNIDSLNGQDILNNPESLYEDNGNLYLKKGNNYIGNLGNYQIFKTDNSTGTSDLRILPNIDTTQKRPEVVNYLGNNGKVTLTVREIKLLITKYHSIGENLLTKDSLTVSAGSIITYALEINNVTSSDAHNVTVNDTIPNGLQLINDSITDGGVVNNGTITWTLDIPGNTTKVLKFQALVIDNSISTFENNFTITHENEAGTHSETSNTVVEKLVYPDIKIEKYQAEEGQVPSTEDIRYMEGGDKLIQYQFKVSNNGTGTAKEVKVYDDVPTDFIVQNSTISDNGTCTNHRVTWTLDHLDPGEAKIIGFQAIIPEKTASKSWVNTSFVSHPSLPNDRQSNNVVVEKMQGKISIVKQQSTTKYQTPTYNQLAVSPGDIVTYYITVTNNSEQVQTNITVTDPIPDGLNIVDGSISDSGSFNQNVITWTIPMLAPNESLNLSFKATVPNEQQVTEWKNTATLDQDGLPRSYSNTVVVAEQEDPVSTTSLTDSDPSNNQYSPVNTINNTNNSPNSPTQEKINENRANPITGIDSLPIAVIIAVALIAVLGYLYLNIIKDKNQ